MAGLEALTGPQDSIGKMVAELNRRRDTIVDGLNAIEGISCKRPNGAFYVFPNVTQVPMDFAKIPDYLLYEHGVATLAGTAFGEYGKGYLRLSYAGSMESTKKALVRIADAVANIKK